MTRPIVPEDVRDGAVASIVRAALCTGLAQLARPCSPHEIARRDYARDANLRLVLRGASTPATIAGTPQLAQISQAFLDALTPVSAGADLLSRGAQLDFGSAASILVPGIAIPTAGWVAEGMPIPVRKAATSAGSTLSPHKLAVICVLTGELLRSSNAEELVRAVLLESVGPALDAALFGNAAGDATRPPGLLNGIAPLTPAPNGTKTEILVDDVQALATALGAVAGNGDIVLIAAPGAAAALKMRPQAVEWPVLTSAALPARTVIAVASAAVVSATAGAPVVDASQETEIVFADPASEVVDVGGIVASPLGSLFQTDEVGLRLKWSITWALRDPRGAAWMQSVNW